MAAPVVTRLLGVLPEDVVDGPAASPAPAGMVEHQPPRRDVVAAGKAQTAPIVPLRHAVLGQHVAAIGDLYRGRVAAVGGVLEDHPAHGQVSLA